MGFDVAAGLILLYAAYQGYRRGFAQQTLQLVGLVVGVMYGEALGGQLAPLADPHLTVVPEPLRPTLLFVAAVFVIWLAITMPGSIYLMWYRKKVFGENTPSLGDRLFGAGLGVAKGALAAAVLLHLMRQAPPETMAKAGAVKEHYEQSTAVKIAAKQKIVDQLLATNEATRLNKHL
ncbi:MAG: CvpA family protein, partial [Planctomycetia bacterium]